MSFSAIKAIIFDMDGVLIDTSPAHAAAYAELWSKLDITPPNYQQLAGRGTKHVIAEFAANLSKVEQNKAVSFKQQRALELLKKADISFPDTEASLKLLADLGMPMVVATSASPASANLVLDRLNLRHFFIEIFNVSDVEKPKPAPDLFNKAIEFLQLPPRNILIIEDSEAGIQAALATGANVVSLRQQQSTVIDQPDYLGHYHNLAELASGLIALRGEQ